MEFKDKMLQIRKERGLTQEGFAEALGVSRQAIAKWESGISYPDVEKLITISNLYQVSIDNLLKPEIDDCNSFIPKNSRALSEQEIVFLCEAKRECYAGEGNKVDSSRPGSQDHYYQRGDYEYRDSYFGGEKFIGEEVLYHKATAIWSMNYCGHNLAEEFSLPFLKEALLQVQEQYPFRGPLIYRNGDFYYHCSIQGDVDWFQGKEEIFLGDKLVYECYFHGGIIK
jgi:transcriptional regulator with XRE-family HTH domain